MSPEDVCPCRWCAIVFSGRSSVLDYPSQLDQSRRDPLIRREDNRTRSVGRVRRFVVANGLDVMISTTYADGFFERATDRRVVLGDAGALLRRMRRVWGGPFPWVALAETQPRRSERAGVPVFNSMVLTPSLPPKVFDLVRESWKFGGGGGYNGVDVTRWESAGKAAGYASKSLSGYASKSLGLAPAGEQSYRVAEGFQPARVEVDLKDPHNSAVEAAQAWSAALGLDVAAFADMRESERPGDAVWLSWRAA